MKKLLIILLYTVFFSTTSYSQLWKMFTTENSELPTNTIENIVVDANDNIWFHNKNSIYNYNQYENKWNEFNEDNSNLKKGFTHIEIGKDGAVYVSSGNIYKFDSEFLDFNIIEENINCDSFTFDKNGVLYYVKQVGVFAKVVGKVIEIYNGQFGGPNYPTDLIIDDNEILWFAIDGYNNALYRYNGTKLDTLDSIFKENPRIGINSISIDKNSNIWLGNGLDGVLLNYNIDNGSWIYYDNKNSPLGNKGMFSKDSKTDNSNNVWVISALYNSLPPISLFKYNGSNWREFSIDEAFNITGDELFSLLSLAIDSKNNVWIGTDKGLIKFNETITSVENSTENSIILYPNPTNNQLTIDLSEHQAISFTISDIKGDIIETRKEIISGEFNIDLQAFTTGTYFIELTLANNQKISKKFVRE